MYFISYYYEDFHNQTGYGNLSISLDTISMPIIKEIESMLRAEKEYLIANVIFYQKIDEVQYGDGWSA